MVMAFMENFQGPLPTSTNPYQPPFQGVFPTDVSQLRGPTMSDPNVQQPTPDAMLSNSFPQAATPDATILAQQAASQTHPLVWLGIGAFILMMLKRHRR